MQDAKRHVASTTIGEKYLVSTVFLGLDHGFWKTPMFFETMVFKKVKPKKIPILKQVVDRESMDDYTARYTTWTQAEIGHKRIVSMVRSKYGKKS
jgi:hypothetical protein